MTAAATPIPSAAPQAAPAGPAIRLVDVGIRFLSGSQRAILRGTLRKLAGLRSRSVVDARAAGEADVVERWALRHVDLEVPTGTRLGVCGNNGSGKTTLMRLMSGIYRPDEGVVRVRGETSALLTIGAGVSVALSGFENLLLMAALHGIGRDELTANAVAIQRFSGLDAATLRTPVRYYSAGMRARLAFALYAILTPEILLVDEILSVGDAEFRRRSAERLREMTRSAACVVLCSHNLTFLQQTCDKGLWIHEGRVRAEGTMDHVAAEYRAFLERRA